jgi:hypothetical protein
LRIPKLSKWQPVKIEWTDSCGSNDGWHEPNIRALAPSKCITIGMLIKQSPDSLSVVLSRGADGKAVDGIITIPTFAMTAVTRLL